MGIGMVWDVYDTPPQTFGMSSEAPEHTRVAQGVGVRWHASLRMSPRVQCAGSGLFGVLLIAK